MKTKLTLRIDGEVLRNAKEYARRQGIPLSRVVEQVLRQVSANPAPSFSKGWRERFRPAARDGERFERLAKKYL